MNLNDVLADREGDDRPATEANGPRCPAASSVLTSRWSRPPTAGSARKPGSERTPSASSSYAATATPDGTPAPSAWCRWPGSPWEPTCPTSPPATDADRAEWIPIDEALARDLAFDHAQILRDGVERARAKLEYTTIATAFCDATFNPARPTPGLSGGLGHRDRPPQLPAQSAERHGFRGGDRRRHPRTGKAGEGLSGWRGDGAVPRDHATLNTQPRTDYQIAHAALWTVQSGY